MSQATFTILAIVTLSALFRASSTLDFVTSSSNRTVPSPVPGCYENCFSTECSGSVSRCRTWMCQLGPSVRSFFKFSNDSTNVTGASAHNAVSSLQVPCSTRLPRSIWMWRSWMQCFQRCHPDVLVQLRSCVVRNSSGPSHRAFKTLCRKFSAVLLLGLRIARINHRDGPAAPRS